VALRASCASDRHHVLLSWQFRRLTAVPLVVEGGGVAGMEGKGQPQHAFEVCA
jgi:hypothetical protein